jgi:hypothetical protein
VIGICAVFQVHLEIIPDKFCYHYLFLFYRKMNKKHDTHSRNKILKKSQVPNLNFEFQIESKVDNQVNMALK